MALLTFRPIYKAYKYLDTSVLYFLGWLKLCVIHLFIDALNNKWTFTHLISYTCYYAIMVIGRDSKTLLNVVSWCFSFASSNKASLHTLYTLLILAGQYADRLPL